MESNVFLYDRPYTDLYPIILTSQECHDLSSAGGCTKELALVPSEVSGGDYAKLSVKFTKTDLRRRAEALSCGGLAVGIGLGVHSSFGGVTFPFNFAQNGGQMVVEPSEAPSARSDEPEFVCAAVDEPRTVVSSARPGSPGGPRAWRWLVATALIGRALVLLVMP